MQAIELTASELVFQLMLEQGGSEVPVNFHMKPYNPSEMQRILDAFSTPMRRLDGQNIRMQQSSAEAVCCQVFDKHFLRMSNIQGPDGTSPSLEEQKAYLEQNPSLKLDVIKLGYGGFAVQPLDDANDVPKKFVLGAPPILEVRLTVPVYDPQEDLKESIHVVHRLTAFTAQDRGKYEKATGEGVLNIRKKEFKNTYDYTAMGQLYDKLAASVAGMTMAGVPCTELNRAEWIPLVPFWQKYIVVEEVFNQGRAKNV